MLKLAKFPTQALLIALIFHARLPSKTAVSFDCGDRVKHVLFFAKYQSFDFIYDFSGFLSRFSERNFIL